MTSDGVHGSRMLAWQLGGCVVGGRQLPTHYTSGSQLPTHYTSGSSLCQLTNGVQADLAADGGFSWFEEGAGKAAGGLGVECSEG